MACYQLGAAVVDAKDFTNATATMDSTTHLWEVGASTTADATDRMSAMARQVGIGGQMVIVVDGVVASAPRWETTEFPGRAVITGLADERAADGLANRINHP